MLPASLNYVIMFVLCTMFSLQSEYTMDSKASCEVILGSTQKKQQQHSEEHEESTVNGVKGMNNELFCSTYLDCALDFLKLLSYSFISSCYTYR